MYTCKHLDSAINARLRERWICITGKSLYCLARPNEEQEACMGQGFAILIRGPGGAPVVTPRPPIDDQDHLSTVVSSTEDTHPIAYTTEGWEVLIRKPIQDDQGMPGYWSSEPATVLIGTALDCESAMAFGEMLYRTYNQLL